MEAKENQFVKLPTQLQLRDNSNDDLDPKDKLIYICIRKYMNAQTGVAFPKLSTIAIESGSSVATVKKTVQKLVELEYISTEVVGKITYYKFNPIKYFEVFSYDFLNLNDITFTEKAFLVASQQYMYKDEKGIDKIAMPVLELSKKIRMSRSTVIKCIKSLEAKGYLATINSEVMNVRNGRTMTMMIFNLERLFQGIIWALKELNNQVTKNTEDINGINDRLDNQDARMNEQDAKLNEMNVKMDTMLKYFAESQKIIKKMSENEEEKLKLEELREINGFSRKYRVK